MAKIDLLVLQLGQILENETKMKLPAPDRTEMIVSAIRTVQDIMPNDCFINLLGFEEFTMNGTDTYVVPTDPNFKSLISLKCSEDDGEYGYAWDEMGRLRFDAIRKSEGIADFDATATRIFTQRGVDYAATIGEEPTVTLSADLNSGYDLYPIPPDTYLVRLDYVMKSSESGELTLPSFLHSLVLNCAAGTIIEGRQVRFEKEAARIRTDWWNKHGLQPAAIGTVVKR